MKQIFILEKGICRLSAAVALIAMLFSLSLTSAVAADSSAINVAVNGGKLIFKNLPIEKNGIILVPMRELFEEAGASIEWDDPTQSVTAVRGANTVVAVINDNHAVVNGKTVILEQPPILYDGRTYVPLRFMAESLGANVKWTEASKTVDVSIAAIQPAIAIKREQNVAAAAPPPANQYGPRPLIDLNSAAATIPPANSSANVSGNGSAIWSENFSSFTASTDKNTKISAFKKSGFSYGAKLPVTEAVLTENSCVFAIRADGGNNYLKMNKPKDLGFDQNCVYSFAKTFDTPLVGKYSFEMRINIDNFPGPAAADYEGTGNVVTERTIFIGDIDPVKNVNPKLTCPSVIFTNDQSAAANVGSISAGDGKTAFNIKTWYTIKIDADTNSGTYSAYIDGKPIKENIPMSCTKITSFGLYAHTGGSGVYIDDLTVKEIK